MVHKYAKHSDKKVQAGSLSSQVPEITPELDSVEDTRCLKLLSRS